MPMSPRLLRPRAAGGFNPRAISGLALWLDAADSATLGPTSSGAGAVSNNGPVKYWGDKSGNGRHATTTNADSNSPTYLATGANGFPALGFDGSPDTLDGSWPVTLTSQTTFAVNMRLSGSFSGGRIFAQSDAGSDASTSGHYIPLLRDVAGENAASYASTGFRANLTVGISTLALLTSRHTGSEIQNSVNNGAQQTFSHTLNKTFTRYRLGADFAGSGRESGRTAEILVYSRSLSDSERNAIARYLGNKWGITVS